MTMLDDSMLALIARFVVDDVENLSISDEKFLKHQVLEIKNHIEDVPREQQQKVILEWIHDHAEQYRKQWQSKAITQLLLHKRCSDCPLIDDGTSSNCTIHDRWIELLKDYLSEKIDSEEYVVKSLQILDDHKQELKISRIAAQLV
ncbi:MAG: hypothetical protein OQL09_07105 [Gammaproteobacteria bacterium]|nr:hypothetical protein [Gammaproteobacteria bacterium]